jgi:hypothetical protein
MTVSQELVFNFKQNIKMETKQIKFEKQEIKTLELLSFLKSEEKGDYTFYASKKGRECCVARYSDDTYTLAISSFNFYIFDDFKSVIEEIKKRI